MCWVQFPGWPEELAHLWFSTSQRNCALLKAEYVIEEKQVIKVNFNIICIHKLLTDRSTQILLSQLCCTVINLQNGGIVL